VLIMDDITCAYPRTSAGRPRRTTINSYATAPSRP
jgi:hypothetical protein